MALRRARPENRADAFVDFASSPNRRQAHKLFSEIRPIGESRLRHGYDNSIWARGIYTDSPAREFNVGRVRQVKEARLGDDIRAVFRKSLWAGHRGHIHHCALAIFLHQADLTIHAKQDPLRIHFCGQIPFALRTLKESLLSDFDACMMTA